MRRRLIGAGALGIALALSIGISYAQQLKGEYKLGVLEPLTGNLAVQGKLHLEGYEIMRDLINTRFGGVMGRKLVLVVGDAPDPTAATSEATRLATRERVKIITGTFSSTLCGAASEAAARQNVIYWETSCVDPRFTQRGLKNVFRTEIDGTGFGWYNIEFIATHLAPQPLDMTVSYSNYAAARDMTLKMARLGYRRIGFVSLQTKENDRARERRRGYVAAMKSLGRAPDAALMVQVSSGLSAGAQALVHLVQSASGLDAVFFAGDVLAIGALLECQRRGWDVPSRVAIASFDDLDMLRHVAPPVTTIRLPRYDIGKRTAQCLLDRPLVRERSC